MNDMKLLWFVKQNIGILSSKNIASYDMMYALRKRTGLLCQ